MSARAADGAPAAGEPAPLDDGVARTLAAASGLPLRAFRTAHVAECVRRGMAREGVRTPEGLVGRIARDPAARARFRAGVAVSVSGLYRDPDQFRLLERLLEPILAEPGLVSVWSAGCADGSELSTVALILERLGALDRARLLGSDLLEENLSRARAGRYGDVTMPEAVRRAMRWELRDLTGPEPPRGRWRVILCRNVAIYLEPTAKARLMRRLADALVPAGILLLGRSERLLEPGPLGLEPVGPHAYRRTARWEP